MPPFARREDGHDSKPAAPSPGLALLLGISLTALVFNEACVDIPDPAGGACIDAGAMVTYQGYIRPLLESQCIGCHQEDGTGPFPLGEWGDVSFLAPLIVRAVDEGRMPPAQADPDCRMMTHGRYLSDADRALFRAWQDADYPEGSLCEYVPPAPPPPRSDVGAADLVLSADAPTVLSSTEFDDYRTIEINHVFTETTYVIASRLIPTDPSLVHHGTILMRPGPGSSLPGGVIPVIGGLLPGLGIQELPDGVAIEVSAGSELYLDMHYHVPPLGPESPTPIDNPKVELWVLPPGQTPERLVEAVAPTLFGFSIAAGDADASVSGVVPLPNDTSELFAALPHMHYRGTRLRAELLRSDGSRDCIVDVPNYDFNWQLLHEFDSRDRVAITAGDQLDFTCYFDNSQANQPIVDGEQIPASDVTEGPGSLDEMCQITLLRLRPFEAPTP